MDAHIDFKSRCFIDPATDCWHWLGNSVRGVPIIQICGKRHRVTRLVKLIKPKRYVYMKCGSVDCINPAHIKTRTRSEYMKETAKNRKEPSYIAKRNARLATAKLDKEKAAEIRAKRAEGLTLRQLGERYGVNYETIRNVVTNQSWREASPWAI